MENIWDEILDGLDWDSVDQEVKRLEEEERELDELREYFTQDSFDYKREYIRKFRKAHPEILDRTVISLATEQMLESHECGVELEADDALRFVKSERIKTTSELVKMLAAAGISDGSFFDVISTGFEDDGKRGTVKNPSAKKKAAWLTRYADMLARNKDVLILELPTFEPRSDWTQLKIAFFSDDLNGAEKGCLQQMMNIADRSELKAENGVAVAYFQIDHIWSDFR